MKLNSCSGNKNEDSTHESTLAGGRILFVTTSNINSYLEVPWSEWQKSPVLFNEWKIHYYWKMEFSRKVASRVFMQWEKERRFHGKSHQLQKEIFGLVNDK